MDTIVQVFCELLSDLGVATDSLQQECMQCIDSQSPEEQKSLSDQFISQIKIVFPSSTDDKDTQTEPDSDRPTKRLKRDYKGDNVQITASKEELEKRIANFIALKASENIASNEREFCTPDGTSKTHPATVMRKKQIKLSKNESLEGPLNTTHTLSAPADGKKPHAHIKLPWGVEHRIQNLEHFTDVVQPTPPDVYARLKALEDRVLFLEDSGFLDYLNNRDKTAAPPKSSLPIPDLEIPNLGNPQLANDPNKRIAELVASLQKKSSETSKQGDVVPQ